MKTLVVFLVFIFGISACNSSQKKPRRSLASQGYNEVGPVGGVSPVSFNEKQNLTPQIKRHYEQAARRVKKDDFKIDGNSEQFNDGSLWGERGQVNYLFTENRVRDIGDMVTVEVNSELRKDIIDELKDNALSKAYKRRLKFLEAKRARKKKLLKKQMASSNKKAAEKGKSSLEEEESKEKEEQKAQAEENDKLKKESDIVLAEVIDRYDNGTYKVRGVKEVLFKGKRRELEVSGLVQDKDIDSQGTVKSDDLMDPRVRYIR